MLTQGASDAFLFLTIGPRAPYTTWLISADLSYKWVLSEGVTWINSETMKGFEIQLKDLKPTWNDYVLEEKQNTKIVQFSKNNYNETRNPFKFRISEVISKNEI